MSNGNNITADALKKAAAAHNELKETVEDNNAAMNTSTQNRGNVTTTTTEKEIKQYQKYGLALGGLAAGLAALKNTGGGEGLGKELMVSVNAITKTLTTGLKEANELNQTFGRLSRDLSGDVIGLNQEIGGLSQETLIRVEQGIDKLDPFAQKALDLQSSLIQAQAGMGEEVLIFTDALGQQKNLFDALYDDPAKIVEDFSEILTGIRTQNASAIQELDEKEQVRLVALRKSMNIQSADMAALLTRQYAFTGEASDDIFENIAAVSSVLAEKTNIPLQQIKEGIIEIQKESDLFGDITEEAAGRITVALQSLGVDFATFKGLTEQFLDFDNAAQKMGDLSAMFGIQMDAMEMTYLANEDQEEFLFRMREEIMDAGLDFDSMSKSRQRMLAGQLNMSVEQARTFLRTGDVLSQEELTAATDGAASIDGMSEAIKKFADTTEGAMRTTEQQINSRMQAIATTSIGELAKIETKAATASSAIQNVSFTEEQLTNYNNMLGKVSTMMQDKVLLPVQETTAAIIQGMTDGLSAEMAKLATPESEVKISLNPDETVQVDTSELAELDAEQRRYLDNFINKVTTQYSNLLTTFSGISSQQERMILTLGDKPILINVGDKTIRTTVNGVETVETGTGE